MTPNAASVNLEVGFQADSLACCPDIIGPFVNFENLQDLGSDGVPVVLCATCLHDITTTRHDNDSQGRQEKVGRFPGKIREFMQNNSCRNACKKRRDNNLQLLPGLKVVC